MAEKEMGGGKKNQWVRGGKCCLCIDFIVSVPSQMCLTSLTLSEIFLT